MKRWAICKMGDYEGDGARVPKLILYTESVRLWSKDGFDWALCQFAVANLGPINADQDILVLPDITMDLTLGGMTTAARNALMSSLTAKGFTVPATPQNENMRGFLGFLVNQIQPGINVETGDIRDVEG